MQAHYIEVRADVRHWEDATVNDIDDDDGTLIPFRVNESWHPVIRLSDGAVKDWPQGTTADIHYKVCDAGEYWLQDESGARIAKWGGYYVPSEFLCHGDEGYGDYIIMTIAEDGKVIGWQAPGIEMPELGHDEDDLQNLWIATK